ncbi:MAG: L-2-hydroxyglutarate oxidase [Pseudomonadota bacterium]
METCDIAIMGAGIVGAATALELQARLPGARIVVLEKEPKTGRHQTGHNSGVIHAGVYYAPGSLKARFCREGVAATRAFCDDHGIPYETCGKLIVATHEDELDRMRALEDRARANGIEIEPIDQAQVRQMEPHVSAIAGLLSPSTGIVNYGLVAQKMTDLFVARGGVLRTGTRVSGGRAAGDGLRIDTPAGPLSCGRAVACAGLHSDRLIRAFGGSPGYRVVPFRGEYYRLVNQPEDLVRHLIYPVPDPARPFLGVHLTRKLDGGFTVGPNAVLAMKREGYKRTDFDLKDMGATLSYGGFWRMLARNFAPAMGELAASAARRLYLKKVQRYCARVRLEDLSPYPAGVRAQAVAADGKIIDDFLFVETPHCVHVGNAPSPAATSAIPIGRHIADRVLDGSTLAAAE